MNLEPDYLRGALGSSLAPAFLVAGMAIGLVDLETLGGRSPLSSLSDRARGTRTPPARTNAADLGLRLGAQLLAPAQLRLAAFGL